MSNPNCTCDNTLCMGSGGSDVSWFGCLNPGLPQYNFVGPNGLICAADTSWCNGCYTSGCNGCN